MIHSDRYKIQMHMLDNIILILHIIVTEASTLFERNVIFRHDLAGGWAFSPSTWQQNYNDFNLMFNPINIQAMKCSLIEFLGKFNWQEINEKIDTKQKFCCFYFDRSFIEWHHSVHWTVNNLVRTVRRCSTVLYIQYTVQVQYSTERYSTVVPSARDFPIFVYAKHQSVLYSLVLQYGTVKENYCSTAVYLQYSTAYCTLYCICQTLSYCTV